jgi:hypothetical protein
MAFPYTVNLSYGQEKVETEEQKQKLGTRATTPDGRVFYYAQCASGAAISTGGFLVDGLVTEADHDMDKAATAAHSVGDTTISLEITEASGGSGDLVKDEYADGYMMFNDGPGEGEVYRIKSHPAHDASSDPTAIFTLDEPDGIRTALTTDSICGLFKSPYNAIAIVDGDAAPTTRTGVLGVTTIPVTASYYCWVQTSGIATVALGAQVGVVGDALTISQESSESGMAERADFSDESDLATIGVAIGIPSVSGDKQACILHIRS